MKKILPILFNKLPNNQTFTRYLSCTTTSNIAQALTNDDQLAKRRAKSPVWSWNEWDTLQECVVGIPDYAVVPTMDHEVKACMSADLWDFLEKNGGKYWADVLPKEHWKKAQEEIEGLCKAMEREGVKVVRPDVYDWGKEFMLPNGMKSHGIYAAMPRDSLLVVGDEIIEATMTWRSRYFEFVSFRSLVKSYYDNGAKWTAAPKPLLKDELFHQEYDFLSDNKLKRVITEEEICFDAADFFRCGRDIFGQRSHVTNFAAIHWLRRHLAPQGIRVHDLHFYDGVAMHVDATLVPLRPGLFLKNPNYALAEQEHFTNCGWDFVDVDQPLCSDDILFMSSNYLAMNTLMMDSKRVFMEKDEHGTKELFEKLGVECIPVSLKHCFGIGGGFHCWTCDTKRDGTLENYFNWSDAYMKKYNDKYGHLYE